MKTEHLQNFSDTLSAMENQKLLSTIDVILKNPKITSLIIDGENQSNEKNSEVLIKSESQLVPKGEICDEEQSLKEESLENKSEDQLIKDELMDISTNEDNLNLLTENLNPESTLDTELGPQSSLPTDLNSESSILTELSSESSLKADLNQKSTLSTELSHQSSLSTDLNQESTLDTELSPELNSLPIELNSESSILSFESSSQTDLNQESTLDTKLSPQSSLPTDLNLEGTLPTEISPQSSSTTDLNQEEMLTEELGPKNSLSTDLNLESMLNKELGPQRSSPTDLFNEPQTKESPKTDGYSSSDSACSSDGEIKEIKPDNEVLRSKRIDENLEAPRKFEGLSVHDSKSRNKPPRNFRAHSYKDSEISLKNQETTKKGWPARPSTPSIRDIDVKRLKRSDEGRKLPFKNSFTSAINNGQGFKEFSVSMMCPYNSVFHAFLALFKYEENLKEIYQNAKEFHPLIKLVVDVAERTLSRAENQQKWMQLLADNFRDKFTNSESRVNMVGDVNAVIDKLFEPNKSEDFFTWRRLPTKCEQTSCDGYSIGETHAVLALILDCEVLTKKLENGIEENLTEMPNECESCKSKITSKVNFEFKNLLIINCSIKENLNVQISKIPKKIVLNDESYELRIVIVHPAMHFKSFYRLQKNDFIELDDLCGFEVMQRNLREKVNAKILIYVKGSREEYVEEVEDPQMEIEDQELPASVESINNDSVMYGPHLEHEQPKVLAVVRQNPGPELIKDKDDEVKVLVYHIAQHEKHFEIPLSKLEEHLSKSFELSEDVPSDDPGILRVRSTTGEIYELRKEFDEHLAHESMNQHPLDHFMDQLTSNNPKVQSFKSLEYNKTVDLTAEEVQCLDNFCLPPKTELSIGQMFVEQNDEEAAAYLRLNIEFYSIVMIYEDLMTCNQDGSTLLHFLIFVKKSIKFSILFKFISDIFSEEQKNSLMFAKNKNGENFFEYSLKMLVDHESVIDAVGKELVKVLKNSSKYLEIFKLILTQGLKNGPRQKINILQAFSNRLTLEEFEEIFLKNETENLFLIISRHTESFEFVQLFKIIFEKVKNYEKIFKLTDSIGQNAFLVSLDNKVEEKPTLWTLAITKCENLYDFITHRDNFGRNFVDFIKHMPMDRFKHFLNNFKKKLSKDDYREILRIKNAKGRTILMELKSSTDFDEYFHDLKNFFTPEEIREILSASDEDGNNFWHIFVLNLKNEFGLQEIMMEIKKHFDDEDDLRMFLLAENNNGLNALKLVDDKIFKLLKTRVYNQYFDEDTINEIMS